jgi:hypothetical protein
MKEAPQIFFEADYNPSEKDYSILEFNKFLIKNGLLNKSKHTLSKVFRNFNYFFYYNQQFIYKNYPTQK